MVNSRQSRKPTLEEEARVGQGKMREVRVDFNATCNVTPCQTRDVPNFKDEAMWRHCGTRQPALEIDTPSQTSNSPVDHWKDYTGE